MGVSGIRLSFNKRLPSSYYKLGSVLVPEEVIFKGWEKSVNKIWAIPIFKILQKRKGSMK